MKSLHPNYLFKDIISKYRCIYVIYVYSFKIEIRMGEHLESEPVYGNDLSLSLSP